MREFNTRTTEGNYSITFETDDRKAFEQVQSLCRLLVDGKDGDTISVEWLKKKKVDFQNEDLPFNYCRGMQDGFNGCIDYLLSEWEEEEK